MANEAIFECTLVYVLKTWLMVRKRNHKNVGCFFLIWKYWILTLKVSFGFVYLYPKVTYTVGSDLQGTVFQQLTIVVYVCKTTWMAKHLPRYRNFHNLCIISLLPHISGYGDRGGSKPAGNYNYGGKFMVCNVTHSRSTKSL